MTVNQLGTTGSPEMLPRVGVGNEKETSGEKIASEFSQLFGDEGEKYNQEALAYQINLLGNKTLRSKNNLYLEKLCSPIIMETLCSSEEQGDDSVQEQVRSLKDLLGDIRYSVPYSSAEAFASGNYKLRQEKVKQIVLIVMDLLEKVSPERFEAMLTKYRGGLH